MRTLLACFGSAAVLALVLAVFALGRSGEDGAVGRRIESGLADLRTRASSLERGVRELSSHVAVLTDAVEALRAAARDSAAADASTGRPGADVSERLDELSTRFEDVASKLEELRAAPRPVLVTSTPQNGETEEVRAHIVSENQAVALNRSLAPHERLAALRTLRFRDGRSSEVTLAMIELIEDPRLDAATRADIIRNLHGVDFEVLKAPLLTVLQNDTDPEVRSETVETLDVFYDDPAVFEAVAHVRDNDPDRRVRMEAMQRLLPYQQAGAR